MKIVFIIQDLFQQGAQYVTSLIAAGFADKGYEVEILVSKVHENLLKRHDIEPFAVPSNVKIVVLGSERARKNIINIRNYLKTGSCDVVIAMDPNYATALALASIGLKSCPQLAYVEHSSNAGLDPTDNEVLKPKPFSPRWRFKRFILKRFDTLMAVSAGTANAVEHSMALTKGSIEVVYNPVINTGFYEKLKKPSLHPWLVDKNCPVVIAAGAHCSFKNHFMLFQAIKKANERINVKLILFGKGTLTNEYKEWISANNMGNIIDLPGHTANLPAEIKNADAFIVSSDRESFSIVLVEALASGTPVISTDCPFGPPELLSNGTYGTIVPVGDSDAMAEAIIQTVTKPKSTPLPQSWQPYMVDNVVDTYIKALKIWH